MPLGTVDPGEILCFEYAREVTNDYVVRFEYRPFQILKINKTLPRPKDKVVVRIRPDGSPSILWKGKTLLVEEIQIAKKSQSDFHVV